MPPSEKRLLLYPLNNHIHKVYMNYLLVTSFTVLNFSVIRVENFWNFPPLYAHIQHLLRVRPVSCHYLDLIAFTNALSAEYSTRKLQMELAAITLNRGWYQLKDPHIWARALNQNLLLYVICWRYNETQSNNLNNHNLFLNIHCTIFTVIG